MNKALLLVDIQNDYFPGGAMELEGSMEAGMRAEELLRTCREAGMPVIHIQHVSVRPDATYFLPDTDGVLIHNWVAPREDEAVIQKHFPNSFLETPLLEHLRGDGIEELVIAGMMTQTCIDSTTRAAADLGFACELAFDACAARTVSFAGKSVPVEHVQTAILAALNGLFANVRSVDELCQEIKV